MERAMPLGGRFETPAPLTGVCPWPVLSPTLTTDSGVSDFLSGRSPLTLALRRPSGLQSPSPPASCPQAFCRPGSPARSATPAARFRRPGAVIESFVSHAPGVFSGTFSGTLHPSCQDSSGRPRRDISTVLQILNDLLSATRHCQGAPPPLSQLRRQAASSPPPPPATPAATAGSPHPLAAPLVTAGSVVGAKLNFPWKKLRLGVLGLKPATALSLVRFLGRPADPPSLSPPAGDGLRQTENRATRCKVQRLQLLMQQRRLRRKARRDSRGPYGWAAGRKAGRSDSNSSLSSDGSLDLDFDDSVWKPGVKADLNSEFVVA
ncbi:hypothetical protein Z043_114304 [Scleropages formosus]|uniref:Midnolin-like n=1 Tax=Scleropages formosus TaxID=113540 RepID=A0A0P7YIG6_SCLFO|nr:hypothetical protein Z043_114304 [Scleropages formosus]